MIESTEFLIAKWEAKAEELEHMAAQYRQSLTGLVAMTLEKARAYRACISELQRQAELESEADSVSDVTKSDTASRASSKDDSSLLGSQLQQEGK